MSDAHHDALVLCRLCGLVNPAPVRRALPGAGDAPGALCPAAACGRDELLLLPSASACDLCALGCVGSHVFQFAVKIPKEITHTRRLRNSTEPLERFLSEVVA